MKPDIKHALEVGSLMLYESVDSDHSCPIRLSNAGACVRSVQLRTTPGRERALDGQTSRIFKNGHDRGAALAEALKLGLGPDIEIECEAEHWLNVGEWPLVRFDEFKTKGLDCLPTVRLATAPAGINAFVRGHSDVFFRMAPGGRSMIGDFKTTNEWALKRINPDDPTTLNESYVTQVSCYTLAEIDAGRAMDEPFLMFENSNTKELVGPCWIPMSMVEKYGELGRANLRTAVQHMLDHNLADRFTPDEKRMLPWQCNYCSVWQHCWGDSVENTKPGERMPKLRLRS